MAMTKVVYSKTNDRFFTARIVSHGDLYGLNDCLRYQGHDLMIEYYDQTYALKGFFGPRGQFVSRYYIKTLATHDGALCLEGGFPDTWMMDSEAFTESMLFLGYTTEPTPSPEALAAAKPSDKR